MVTPSQDPHSSLYGIDFIDLQRSSQYLSQPQARAYILKASGFDPKNVFQ